MKRLLTCLFALPLFTAVSASAQGRGMGGCARDTQQGYVTATETVRLTYWRGGDRSGTVEPGDELRLCRYEGSNAVVTVWSDGIGFVVPRSAIGELRQEPTLQEVTERDISCVGREIDNIQETYRSEQDWKLLELARQRGVSLSMLAAIRSSVIRITTQSQTIPACTFVDGHTPESGIADALALSQQQPHSPERGSPIRSAVMDGLRAGVRDVQGLNGDIIFRVHRLAVLGNFALATVTPLNPDQSRILSYENAEGMWCDKEIIALLRNDGQSWRVIDRDVGPCDYGWPELFGQNPSYPMSLLRYWEQSEYNF